MKTVLLVEDDENDVFMMRKACERASIPHLLKVVKDGDAAVEYISSAAPSGGDGAHSRPAVVFLDIKLPKRDGHEVLKWIREQPGLESLPVIMLTGSDQTADINRAYELGATSYVQKIANPADFGSAVRIILKYWLEFHVTSSGEM